MAFVPSLAVFRHTAFRQYWLTRVCGSAATQMLATALGWQVYDIARLTRPVEQAALVLGVVGLVQFLPLIVLSLIGGQAADRYDRKRIIQICLIVRALVAGGLVLTSAFAGAGALPGLFAAAAGLGAVNAFFPAAGNALLARLVPRAELPKAVAWNSLAFQGASIFGPAIGGGLYILGPEIVYAAATGLTVLALVLITLAQTPKHVPVVGAKAAEMIREGLAYMRENKIVFGAISLDLVVVLFGGVTALLPVFARDVLDVGAQGLGLMRGAPAVGAACVAFFLATRSFNSKIGKRMFLAVAIYGVAMLAFAHANLFWLALLALAVTGAADMISVYIRQSLIQLATPDAMRGRVAAVSSIFISASNELGEFESGIAARFLGPIGAVTLGGAVAVGAAGLWARVFPELDRVDAFEDAQVVEKPPSSSKLG